jgi:tRNA U34 5-methylaminomethyl-2-thiouridine-forming methyltransferase MnmC
MERNIIITSDGSKSLYLPQWDETYHSRHGAVQEAYHVFIRNGLDLFEPGAEIRILEMGFGTGLNCFITWLESVQRGLTVYYHGLEAYPVAPNLAQHLEYPSALGQAQHKKVFETLHSCPWDEKVQITQNFRLFKRQEQFSEFDPAETLDPTETLDPVQGFDLIYFDAFAPRVQPELWSESMFQVMYEALRNEGVLVTYSAKGSVRRSMQAVGFTVERLPGPPGKREMLRARKALK